MFNNITEKFMHYRLVSKNHTEESSSCTPYGVCSLKSTSVNDSHLLTLCASLLSVLESSSLWYVEPRVEQLDAFPSLSLSKEPLSNGLVVVFISFVPFFFDLS